MSIQVQDVPIGLDIPCTYRSWVDGDDICGSAAVEILVAWDIDHCETLGAFCAKHKEEETR